MEQQMRILLKRGEVSAVRQGEGYDTRLIKAEDICAAANRGDALAVKVVTEAALYMGIALGNLVNLFNPEVIIMGGPVPRSNGLYIATAAKVMKERANSALAAGVIVKKADYTEVGGAIGAANYALDQHTSYAL